jgi:hypothetical protein
MNNKKNTADSKKDMLITSCPYFKGYENMEETKVAKCNEKSDYIEESWVLKNCNLYPCNCSLFVRSVKRDYPKGTRIKLLSMMGEPQMHLGTIGVVNSVDDIGQVHMKWNNGSRLALNVYMDKFEKLND